MSEFDLSSARRAELQAIQLPATTTTEWGVPILDTHGFQDLTQGPPNGYRPKQNVFSNYPTILQWHSPETGGVAVVVHDFTDEETPRSSDAPRCQLECGIGWGDLTVGKAPRDSNPYHLAPRLGFLTLARTDTLTIVQTPGAEEYRTAYRHVHGKDPVIDLDTDNPGYAPPRKFLEFVAKGLWPYDMHFFTDHAAALIIGGETLGRTVIEQARCANERTSRDKISGLTGLVDNLAYVPYRLGTAQTRVRHFQQTGEYTGRTAFEPTYQPTEAAFDRFSAQRRRRFASRHTTSLPK